MCQYYNQTLHKTYFGKETELKLDYSIYGYQRRLQSCS